MNKKYIIGIWLTLTLLLQYNPTTAQDTKQVLGGGDGQLNIEMLPDGKYFVHRTTKQFYEEATIFTIKIGDIRHSSFGFTITDEAPVNKGTIQERSKVFSSTHRGQPFNIVLKFTYNTSNPDYFIMSLALDLTNIPAETSVSLGLAFDAYVNGWDGGAAVTVPDLGYNGIDIEKRLSPEEVQSLRLTGGMNTREEGSLIGFFTMGRPFDRAYSARYDKATSIQIVESTQNNLFKFGPYNNTGGSASEWDNGIGIAYDNIPAATITTIRHGLTFSNHLDGELDYKWNGSKNLIANTGDNINLNLKYTSYTSTQLSGVGFKVDFPGLKIAPSGYTQDGFTSGTEAYTPENEYYQLSNATIEASAKANITIPVIASQCGQWIIDGSTISETSHTLPLEAPATLTVRSPINLASNTTSICPESNLTFIVKLPEGITTHQDATINLSYTGATTKFTALPPTVTIPEGQNNASFTITSSATATDNTTLTVSLSAIQPEFITMGSNTAQTITISCNHLEPNYPEQAIWFGFADNDWFNLDNWANPADADLSTLEAAPGSRTKVFIPGLDYRGSQLNQDNPIKNFPILNEAQLPECDEITFFQGGQIGRIDLLKYNKAHVQLNFPADEATTGIPFNNPDQFYNFAKGYSTHELAAGRWHMLSMPIKGVVSGDFGYGGFPMTFMRKFDVLADGTGRFSEGDWSTSYTETTEPLNPGEGFIFYMYRKGTNFGEIYNADNGNSIDPRTGSTHSISGQPNYGLLQTASIIEFPTYDNPAKLNSHRIQKYESDKSTFYNIAVDETYRGAILDSYSEKTRSNEDFKLITEDFSYFAYAADREVLLGNPYISALDFNQFYQSHRTGATPRINNYYKIWDGEQFLTFDCENQTVIGGGETIPFTQYIAPMQSFIVKGSNPDNSQFNFTAETLSTVTPGNTSAQLRSNTNPNNCIRISAANQYTTTDAVIRQTKESSITYKEGEDISKLFSPSRSHSYVPEIYTQAGETALTLNSINNVSANIPIGVRLPASGTTTLKLTGMNNYNAGKIELIDGATQTTIADITNSSHFEHTFNNEAGGYQNGRFYLRITQSTTGIENNPTNKNIQVYEANKTIHVTSSPNDLIRQIRIYDIQGRTLYNNTSINTDIYQVKVPFEGQQILIIHITTENNVRRKPIKN